jgi:UDP-N-acetylglucosamine--N-acetylmuramyl-(pentapeptide) pyrophosphoryl-undecaprenol N-acetylglucosamine transferase
VAHELRGVLPEVRCRFLCSTREIDRDILSRATLGGAPVEFEAVPAQPFGVRPRALLRFVSHWGKAVRAGREAVRGASRPVTLVAMGGFVAAPLVQAARVERVPILMVNLDAVPGKANRWIARHARRVLTAAPVRGVQPGPAWETIPPIVRTEAVVIASPEACRGTLGLDPGRPTLLVTGASQGAGSINRFMQAFVRERAPSLGGWQVIHQTGKTDVEETRAAYARAGVPALVEPFFHAMGVCWRAADLAVSRAGAGSVAEAWANAVPAVFMPYPFHKDEHQRHNAAVLSGAGGAIVATDLVDPAKNAAAVGPVLAELLADAARRAAMRRAIAGLGPVDGAARVARAVIDLG